MAGMFKRWQRMPRHLAGSAVDEARRSPFSDPCVQYPEWYMQRWHFLPEGYFSERSIALYDRRVSRVYNAGRQQRAIRLVLDAVRESGARDILEIGCGSGRALAAIAHLPGVAPIGLDLSPFALEAASARAGALAPRLLHADCTALPFEAHRFDAVVAMHVLGHIPYGPAQAAVAEAARVLRPGGRLIVADHRWHRLPLQGWGEHGCWRTGLETVAVRVMEYRGIGPTE
jgi:SAM-dependent methyltransferase